MGIRRGVKEGARRIFARGFCTSFPTSPLLYRSAKSKGKTKDSGCQPCCGLTRVFHPQEKERKPRSSSHLALACCPNDALPSRCPPCALGRRCPEPRCGGVAPIVHHQGAIARSSNQGVVVARPYCIRFHRCHMCIPHTASFAASYQPCCHATGCRCCRLDRRRGARLRRGP